MSDDRLEGVLPDGKDWKVAEDIVGQWSPDIPYGAWQLTFIRVAQLAHSLACAESRAARAEAERDRLAKACDEIIDSARIGMRDEWGHIQRSDQADLDEARAAIDAVLGLASPGRGEP